MKTCSIEVCDEAAGETGLCFGHRARQRLGQPMDSKIMKKPAKKSVDERFWEKVNKTGDCWTWTAFLDKSGYGRFRLGSQMRLAPRVAWELTEGEIPEGYEIDHLCHNPACVNTHHLALTTRQENTQNISGAHRRSKTGVRGVYPCGNKFRVNVNLNGKSVHIGVYPTLAEARYAAINARRAAGYHSDDQARAKMRHV